MTTIRIQNASVAPKNFSVLPLTTGAGLPVGDKWTQDGRLVGLETQQVKMETLFQPRPKTELGSQVHFYRCGNSDRLPGKLSWEGLWDISGISWRAQWLISDVSHGTAWWRGGTYSGRYCECTGWIATSEDGDGLRKWKAEPQPKSCTPVYCVLDLRYSPSLKCLYLLSWFNCSQKQQKPGPPYKCIKSWGRQN